MEALDDKVIQDLFDKLKKRRLGQLDYSGYSSEKRVICLIVKDITLIAINYHIEIDGGLVYGNYSNQVLGKWRKSIKQSLDMKYEYFIVTFFLILLHN